VVAFSLANAALVIVQWWSARAAGINYSPDAIIGLFNDAHQQATFAYTAAVLSLACLAPPRPWPRRIAWAGYAALNIFVGFVSQGQKATGTELVVVAIAALVAILQSRARLTRVAIALPVAGILLAGALFGAGSLLWGRAAAVVTGNLLGRLKDGGYQGLAFVGDLGVVQMIGDFTRLSVTDPTVVFVGMGPSNFGSPAALTRLNRGDATRSSREMFWREVASEAQLASSGELRLLGLSAKTSVLGVLLGEYGGIALLAFLYLLAWPLTLSPRGDSDAVRRLFWLKVAYVGVVLQSVLSTLGAWDNDVVMTILMAGFAGALAYRPAALPGPARAAADGR
jgi:hypothetical protein